MSLSSLTDDSKNSCLNCLKRKDSLFSDLGARELKIIDKNRYTVSYKPGEIICKEGTKPLGLICLNKGKVKMVRRRLNGTEQIVGLKQSVDFIDFRALMVGNTCLSSSIALEKSNVCIIEKKDFFKVIEINKKLAFKIIRSLALELIKKDSNLVNMTEKHIRARLAEALILINNVFRTNPGDGFLNVSLKRSELAGLSNMTTANAIRVLSYFSKAKLVEVVNRKIRIIDLKALKEISALDR